MHVATIREMVQQDCRREQNAFGPSFFEQHLAVVAEFGAALAKRLGADPEVVELAAWLHDISAVSNVATIPNHATLGGEIATQLLSEAGYPAGVIEQVAQCIRSHSTPIPVGSASPEEVCVSNADAISQIVRPSYWLYFAFCVRKCTFEEGRQWLQQRVQSNWTSLIDPARELALDQYRLTKSAFCL